MGATQKPVKALNAQIEMMRRDRILTAAQKRERIDRLMATGMQCIFDKFSSESVSLTGLFVKYSSDK
ncbi:hypothetical protein [Yersinia artesiana]|uniref:hypothetical protein n=1 Tax=Yersinia artesiana TaxID=2890315 RepID=UPI001D12AB1D|nr:hypothetical protein [Yersinia artesiana]